MKTVACTSEPAGIHRNQTESKASCGSRARGGGVDLDAAWRGVQYVVHSGERIPIHGGHAEAGVYGHISPSLRDGGYRPSRGNSYLQAVTWEDRGDDSCPVADTLLVSSQSSDPGSPHCADQTEL